MCVNSIKKYLYLVCFSPLIMFSWALAYPLGDPGTSASYRLTGDLSQRPDYEHSRRLSVVRSHFAVGPTEDVDGQTWQWFTFAFERENGQSFRGWLLMDRFPGQPEPPRVLRYLWQEQDDPAIEYIDVSSGHALLPRWSLWQYGWPQVDNGPLTSSDFPQRINFQGHFFEIIPDQKAGFVAIPTKIHEIRINPQLLIGTLSHWRDVAGVPARDLPGKKYTFVERSREDILADIAAGANFIMMPHLPEFPAWLWQESVYIAPLYGEFPDWPQYLYRSNFYGRAAYIDEPAIHNRAHLGLNQSLANQLVPADAARALTEATRAPLYVEIGNYSSRWITTLLKKRFDLGSMHIEETDYPTWEAVWSSIWYEYEAGALPSAAVRQGFEPGQMVAHYNAYFGTSIPPTVANASAIHIAVLRGASRSHGNSRWGISVYAPNEYQNVLSEVRYAFEAGASYLWYWSSWPGSDNTHLPYPYQRAISSYARQLLDANPTRDLNALLHAANTAIVIPYGYTFSPDSLLSVRWLHLERKQIWIDVPSSSFQCGPRSGTGATGRC
ncbi:MAG: hypothetical protein IT446_13195 [Phycisphaerales bacterium]|nr:hypothetical protein [Phycisphaerales bacterium]